MKWVAISAGVLLGAVFGAATGAGLVYAVLWGHHRMTHPTLTEFWGDTLAIVYGAPTGAAAGAVLGGLLVRRLYERHEAGTRRSG